MNKTSLPIRLPQTTFLTTLTLVGFLSFAIPFALGHPQILIGTLVNAGLFSAALYFPKKFLRPLIFMPSLAVLARGLIFGPLTPYLVLMIPFIWVGNWLMVYLFKRFFSAGQKYPFVVLFSSVGKAGFLFLTAFLLFNLKLLPKLFLLAMGPFQLMTALLGGTATYFAKKILNQFHA